MGVYNMTVIKAASRPTSSRRPRPEVEGEIREFVRRDIATPAAATRKSDSELVANNISSLLQRVAGTSVQEIDRLIAELQNLREMLQRRGRARAARDRPVRDLEPIRHAVDQDHRREPVALEEDAGRSQHA